MPKLTGRDTILGFLNSILPMIKGVQVKQRIVDGDYVVAVLDMETVNDVDHVVDVCLVKNGEIGEIRALYYPSQVPRSGPSLQDLGYRLLERIGAIN
jgi:hypothetical protein